MDLASWILISFTAKISPVSRLKMCIRDRNITYDKTEDGTLSSKWPSFNYLITPIDNSSLIPTEDGNRWELISKSQGFGGINTEYLVKTFTEQYANGLDLYVTWERSRDFTFIKEIFDNALAMKDVFYTYQKVPIL